MFVTVDVFKNALEIVNKDIKDLCSEMLVAGEISKKGADIMEIIASDMEAIKKCINNLDDRLKKLEGA